MTIERKLLGTTPVSGGIEPEAVSFGPSDYLSRSSDLTGNALTKQMTLSWWIYNNGSSGYAFWLNGSYVRAEVGASGTFNFIGLKVGANDVLRAQASAGAVPINTWSHVLISFDLTNTSNRHFYVNDVDASSYMGWNVYSNENLHMLGSNVRGPDCDGRHSHIFLDYTYRNLSTTSNRRLFITAEGKPADSDTLAALNPIIYLPLIDAATAGSNSGTGGDFTVNGVLATAERGPNQDNCSASVFDGSADYMTRASIGASNSKVFTVSGTINVTGGDGLVCKFYKNGHGTLFQITTNIYGSLYIKAYNASYQNRFYVQWKNSIGANNALMPNHNYHFSLSVDMSDTSKRHLIINGAAVSPTYTYYTDVEMGFSAIDLSRVGFVSGDGYFAGDLGELYFNTTYTDLSTDNPFWDSDTNRPNSVRKVIADTSVTPLVALPMIGNDAGNNLGNGGDFNVVSGPFTGARGGSEFWARSVDFDAGSDWFYRSSLSGVSNSKHFSAVFAFNIDSWTTGKERLFTCHGGSPNRELVTIEIDGSGAGINSRLKNTSNGTIGLISSNQSLSLNQWYVVMLCMDLTDSNKSRIYIDSVNQTLNSNTVVNENIPYTSVNSVWVGNDDAGANNTSDGSFAICYYNNTYIDFSQETNRHKFADQLGYPKDLTPQIEDGDIPNPLVYMKFDPTVSLGTNSGTGGDFSVTATPISGPDVDP